MKVTKKSLLALSAALVACIAATLLLTYAGMGTGETEKKATYFFTNYKQIETEVELDIDFIINRYLSAKLMLHPRYDGTIEDVTDTKEKLQFKELISVGFSHTFR